MPCDAPATLVFRVAGDLVDIEAADTIFRIYDGDEVVTETARTTTKQIARFKVRKPEPPRQRQPAL